LFEDYKDSYMEYVEFLLRLLQIPGLGANSVNKMLAEINMKELLQYDHYIFQKMGWNKEQIQRWFNPDRR
ncbi:MAG TPA: hypothetical protein DD638_02490, partial [Pasteurellaceae bacterium]|nr:hypothetical protein [Pasteurellaceae bacterium]